MLILDCIAIKYVSSKCCSSRLNAGLWMGYCSQYFFNGITGNHNVGAPVVWLEEHNSFRKCFFKSHFRLMAVPCIIWMQLVNFMEFLHRYRNFLLQYNIFNELKYCFIVTKFLFYVLFLVLTLKSE